MKDDRAPKLINHVGLLMVREKHEQSYHMIYLVYTQKNFKHAYANLGIKKN